MKKLISIRKRDESGFTLLEYAAGAAVLLGIVMIGLNAMGEGLSTFFANLGKHVEEFSFTEVDDGSTP